MLNWFLCTPRYRLGAHNKFNYHCVTALVDSTIHIFDCSHRRAITLVQKQSHCFSNKDTTVAVSRHIDDESVGNADITEQAFFISLTSAQLCQISLSPKESVD